MAVPEILTLFAATMIAEAPVAERGRPAHLAVTATVVRPVEIDSLATGDDGAVAVIRSSEPVEVLANAGTLVRGDEHIAILSSDAAGLLFVTIIF